MDIDQDYLTYLYNRKTAIVRNYGTDLFCTHCWMANELDASSCYRCNGEVVSRTDALPLIDTLIQSVLCDGVTCPPTLIIQQPTPRVKKRFNYDVENVKRPDPYKYDVRPISKKKEQSTNFSGGIEIVIRRMSNKDSEPTITRIKDKRLARRYLRSMGLSVTMAEKRLDPDRDVESWIIDL